MSTRQGSKLTFIDCYENFKQVIKIAQGQTNVFRKSTLYESSKYRSKLEQDLKLYNITFPLDPVLNKISFVFDSTLEAILRISSNRYTKAADYISTSVADIPNPVTLLVGQVLRECDRLGPSAETLILDTIETINRLRS